MMISPMSSFSATQPARPAAILVAKEESVKAPPAKDPMSWKATVSRHDIPDELFESLGFTKAMFIKNSLGVFDKELRTQGAIMDNFRVDLGVFHPKVAAKNFSYTLDSDESIKVLDPDGAFSPEELQWLTDRLNEMKDFRKSVQTSARVLMELVEHDDLSFGGRYDLNVANFQQVIDLGELARSKPGTVYEAVVRHILETCEPRDERQVDIEI